jgi:hypothetical protein
MREAYPRSRSVLDAARSASSNKQPGAFERPSVVDEVQSVLYVLAARCAAPLMQRAAVSGDRAMHGDGGDERSPAAVGCGWADRDGRGPGGDARGLPAEARMARTAMLRHYREEVQLLGRDPTFRRAGGLRAGAQESIERDRRELVTVQCDEPYRRKLGLIAERLRRAGVDGWLADAARRRICGGDGACADAEVRVAQGGCSICGGGGGAAALAELEVPNTPPDTRPPWASLQPGGLATWGCRGGTLSAGIRDWRPTHHPGVACPGVPAQTREIGREAGEIQRMHDLRCGCFQARAPSIVAMLKLRAKRDRDGTRSGMCLRRRSPRHGYGHPERVLARRVAPRCDPEAAASGRSWSAAG